MVLSFWLQAGCCLLVVIVLLICAYLLYRNLHTRRLQLAVRVGVGGVLVLCIQLLFLGRGSGARQVDGVC